MAYRETRTEYPAEAFDTDADDWPNTKNTDITKKTKTTNNINTTNKTKITTTIYTIQSRPTPILIYNNMKHMKHVNLNYKFYLWHIVPNSSAVQCPLEQSTTLCWISFHPFPSSLESGISLNQELCWWMRPCTNYTRTPRAKNILQQCTKYTRNNVQITPGHHAPKAYYNNAPIVPEQCSESTSIIFTKFIFTKSFSHCDRPSATVFNW